MGLRATLSMIACSLSAAACDLEERPSTIVGPDLDGTTVQRALAEGRWSVVMTTVGDQYACALEADGDAACWGSNRNGQLGDGTTTDRNVPTYVDGGHDFVMIEATPRANHTCALTADGTAYCWGANAHGQLGDGTTTDRHQPTLVPFGRPFKDITTATDSRSGANTDHTCALGEGGAAWCWGSGDYGQLGSATTSATVPTRVRGGHSFTSIEAAWSRTCAIDLDGVAYCWGRDVGTSVVDVTPAPVGGTLRFEEIEIFNQITCGIATDDATYCWTGVDSPTRTLGGHTFVALGDFGSPCGLEAAGDIYCWWHIASDPVLVFGGNDITSFSGGVDISATTPPRADPVSLLCATSDGAAYCRGWNGSGQLGNANSISLSPELTPVFPPNQPGRPGTVTDLRIVERAATSITLAWTEVDDGTGDPARYRVKYAPPPIDWRTATVGCRSIVGDAIGSGASCTVEGLDLDTGYDFQLMAFRAEDGEWVASTFSGIATGSTHSAVDDLRAVSRDANVTVVEWTQIGDGTGNPANYRVKHASEITDWRQATTACNVVGTEINTRVSCSFSDAGYDDLESFEVQLMSYRVVDGAWVDARYSNVARVGFSPFP